MRNVDKIKTLAADLKKAETSAAAAEEAVRRLEHELGRMKKAVDDRNKQIEKLEQKLNGAVGEVRMLMDAHLIRTCIKYGFAEEFDGELYEHCLLLETGNPEELIKEWELKQYTGEKKGQLIVQAVKRG